MALRQKQRKGRKPRLATSPHRRYLACRHTRAWHMDRLYGHLFGRDEPRRHCPRTRQLCRYAAGILFGPVARRTTHWIRLCTPAEETSAHRRVVEKPLPWRTARIYRRPHLRHRPLTLPARRRPTPLPHRLEPSAHSPLRNNIAQAGAGQGRLSRIVLLHQVD